MRLTAIVFIAIFYCANSLGQAVEVGESGETSKAADYFKGQKKREAKSKRAPTSASSNAPHVLMVHLGTFLDDQAYKWGTYDQKNVGQYDIGVTYRLGEWVNAADFMIRTEFLSYSLDEGSANKLSFLGMIMFPDSSSHFPLYLGLGLGPGFYLKQLRKQSVMSIDYQAVVGLRYLNAIDNLGFFVEFGLKNHLHVFSEGQFNGLFLGVGTVWTF